LPRRLRSVGIKELRLYERIGVRSTDHAGELHSVVPPDAPHPQSLDQCAYYRDYERGAASQTRESERLNAGTVHRLHSRYENVKLLSTTTIGGGHGWIKAMESEISENAKLLQLVV
jgi:hypothetical protein